MIFAGTSEIRMVPYKEDSSLAKIHKNDTSNIPAKKGSISRFNSSQTNNGHEQSQSNWEKHDEESHKFEATIQIFIPFVDDLSKHLPDPRI